MRTTNEMAFEGQMTWDDFMEQYKDFQKNPSHKKPVVTIKTEVQPPVTTVPTPTPKPSKIDDFGEKIGGARKDRYPHFSTKDLAALSSADLAAKAQKDVLWPAPKYKKLYEEGRNKVSLFFTKKVRDALLKTPTVQSYWSKDHIEETCRSYIRLVTDLRDRLDLILDPDCLLDFKKYLEENGYIEMMSPRYYRTTEKGNGVISTKLVNVLRHVNYEELNKEMTEKKFLFTKEEKLKATYSVRTVDPEVSVLKSGYRRVKNRIQYLFWIREALPNGLYKDVCFADHKLVLKDFSKDSYFIVNDDNILVSFGYPSEEAAKEAILSGSLKQNLNTGSRKVPFSYPSFTYCEMTGADYRHGKDVTGDDLLHTFGFYGGEFGNWMSQEDRQTSMNLAYDSFMNLAKALEIEPDKIGFNGLLSIAFGARGHGKALAHYEALRHVINLTKMKGAGSLGHEYFHAIDFIAGERNGIIDPTNGPSMSDHVLNQIPEMRNLVRTMKENPDRSQTKFYRDAKALDTEYSKCSKGYWHSTKEMFARAGAAWLYDKLTSMGIKDTYLCGHADAVASGYKGDVVFGAPQGEERKRIDKAFDALLSALKKMHYIG